MDSAAPAWERRLVDQSTASAATVLLVIAAVALVAFSSPPRPRTGLDLGMEARPGTDAGPAARADGAKGVVAGERAARRPPSRVSPRAAVAQ
jgi:hypothetical protein